MSSVICFAVTGFTGHYPIGTCAVVYAHDREDCKRVLLAKIREEGSSLRQIHQNADEWTISPLTPVPDKPSAHILLNGDY